MIEAIKYYRSRITARNARPEPHSRLTAAVLTASALAETKHHVEQDVELMALVADIAFDTLSNLECRHEITKVDAENARRVLASARVLLGRSDVTEQHMDSLSERIDMLATSINMLDVPVVG